MTIAKDGDVRDIGKGMCVIGRAHRMGLGSMTEDFCRAMKPEKIILVDTENGLAEDFDPAGGAKADGAEVVRVKASEWDGNCGDVRLIVGFETFYGNKLPYPRGGVKWKVAAKTVLFPMWECTPEWAYHADLVIYPSRYDCNFLARRYARCTWPASRAVATRSRRINWPPRTFVHIAGNANHNRNSTREVLAASQALVGTGARLWVFHNFPIPYEWMPPRQVIDEVIGFRGSAPTRNELYSFADCVVHPQQIQGLSLPISEAAGEGIPTIVSDLPEWRSWPDRVNVRLVGQRGYTRLADTYEPDVAELGEKMRGMAMGEVSMALPPTQPTWDEFKSRWLVWMKAISEGYLA